MGTYLNYLKRFERPTKKKGLTITVTGLSGSGKSTVAEAIALAFKLKTFNAGDLQRQFARQKKITLDQASKILPRKIDIQMDKAVLEKANQGGYVLTGRLAGWTAGDWADCRVFVDCQKRIRVLRVARRDNLTIKEACKKVSERDQADIKRYQTLYGVNVRKMNIYNLFIRNDKPGKDKIKRETVNKIKKFLKGKNNLDILEKEE